MRQGVGRWMENRRAGFKFHGMTTEELRRRREENQVEIRKAKREDSLNKRRNLVDTSTPAASPAVADVQPESGLSSPELEDMAKGLFSGDLQVRYKATKFFRKLLSKEQNPPIDDVLQLGVVGRFVEILASADVPDTQESAEIKELLQFEAAWVLTNIASGTTEHTQVVIQSGAFPIFVQLLSHSSAELRGQCIWAIGNVAGEGPDYRDSCLQFDVLSPLLNTLVSEMASNYPNHDLAKNTTWAISNLCRGKPSPSWDQIAPALPILVQILYQSDEDLVGEASWAVAYMSDGSSQALEGIIQSGVVPRLVQLLASRQYMVQASCVRTLGNIVTGDDAQTQLVIDAGALPAFGRLFVSTSRSILRETCWAISNVTAGNVEQIKAVIEANLIPPLIQNLAAEFFSIKREACWAVCNATSVHASCPDVIKYLVSQGCIKPLCDILTVKDVKIIQVALDGLENILAVGQMEAINTDDHMNPYALHIEEAGGLATISALQEHINMNIYHKSKSIIDKYYSEEGYEEGLDVSESFKFNPNAAVPQGGFDFS